MLVAGVDGAFGNVKRSGADTGLPEKKTFRQAGDLTLLADPEILAVETGRFAIITLPRACRPASWPASK